MTTVSVVMPTYNRAATISRAILSVLNQPGVEAELVVVDDNSTDDTARVVQRYGDRLKYLALSAKHGSNFARNRGIEYASGDIISFIDSDDEFLPHKLKFVSDFFAANPDVDVLIDSFETVYPDDMRRPPARRYNPVITDNALVREAVFNRRLFKATPAISVRRQALLDVGLFDDTLTRRQDMDLILRLSAGHACVSTDQILWIKHWTAGAISSKQNTFLAATIEICERHPDYLSEEKFRRGLDRDLGRHFLRLVLAGRVADFRSDLKRYRSFGKFGVSPWLLMLQYGQQRGKRLIASRRHGKELRHQREPVVAPTQ